MSAIVSVQRFRLSSGSVEALKWIALASMLIDHVNKAVFDSGIWIGIPLGRIAMPIFSLLMAYNLARPNVDYNKTLRRLVIFGLLASPFHSVLMHGHALPINILFTFAASVMMIQRMEQRRFYAALVVFFIAGLFVDYSWVGPCLVVSCWFWLKARTPVSLFVLAISAVAYCAFLGNAWSLLALPLIWAATLYTPHVPRYRWLFWAFYPLHLAVLWAIVH